MKKCTMKNHSAFLITCVAEGIFKLYVYKTQGNYYLVNLLE